MELIDINFSLILNAIQNKIPLYFTVLTFRECFTNNIITFKERSINVIIKHLFAITKTPSRTISSENVHLLLNLHSNTKNS